MTHDSQVAPAHSWSDVRARAADEGRLDEQKLAAHKQRLLATQLAHELAQRRQAAGTDLEVLAKLLEVPPAELALIEQGQLDQLRVATLRAYVSALGGELHITAKFADEQPPND
jgi:hypothetical protein